LASVGNGSGLIINGRRICRLIRYRSSDARQELCLAYPILNGTLVFAKRQINGKSPKKAWLEVINHPYCRITGYKSDAISEAPLPLPVLDASRGRTIPTSRA
jgi:hypothetical protein